MIEQEQLKRIKSTKHINAAIHFETHRRAKQCYKLQANQQVYIGSKSTGYKASEE